MNVNQPHYLPLPLPFFSILVGVFVFLVVLLQVRTLRYAYMSIGFSAGGAMLPAAWLVGRQLFHYPGGSIAGTAHTVRASRHFLWDALRGTGRHRLCPIAR
jgi:hypothetical protein